MTPRRGGTQGFTLAEAALALAVLSIVIGALLPALLSLRAGQQAAATLQNMETVMRAVSVFTSSRGCLPCPMPPGFYNTSGRGLLRGEGTPVCGSCDVPVGMVPFVSLGLPESLAKDGYGRWLTYAVDAALTADFGVIPPFTACQSSDTGTDCSTEDKVQGRRSKGLCDEAISATSRLKVRLIAGVEEQEAAVMLVSHGPNGYGAYKAHPAGNNDRLAFPADRLCPEEGLQKGVGERCNANNNRYFFAGMASSDYDDSVLYLSRNMLVSYLGNPSCETAP